MKNIEICDWTPDDVRNNPDKIFVYGDNNLRMGKSGLSSMRDMPNTLGIRIKKGPSEKTAGFYLDSDIDIIKKILIDDITSIKLKMISGKKIVLSSIGYGNVEKINDKSSVIYNYIVNILRDNFEFDNLTGNNWKRIPSKFQISTSKVIPIDDLSYQNKSNLMLSNDIKTGRISALSFKSEFKIGDLIKISNMTDDLICRVTSDSYPSNNLSPNDWSLLEGCDINLYTSDKLQIQIQYICSMSSSGVISYNDNTFGSSVLDLNLPEVLIIDEINDIQNNYTLDMTKEIPDQLNNTTENNIADNKIDIILEKLEFMSNRLSLIEESVIKKEIKTKSFFNKKQISDFIKKWKIEGKLCLINNDKNEIYTLSNDKYFYIIELRHGKIWNDCKIVKKIERLKLEYNIIDVFSQIYLVIKDENPILLSNSIFIKNGQLSIDYINNQIC